MNADAQSCLWHEFSRRDRHEKEEDAMEVEMKIRGLMMDPVT